MQGFLFARDTGDYTLSIGRNGEPSSGITVDNSFGVWSDISAYQYTNYDSDFRARRQGLDESFQQINGRTTYQMVSGEVKPITAIFLNGGGAASYQFYLYPPGGQEVTDTSSYFIPACDQGNPFLSG
ncbi:Putative GLEYA adhesin domain-containing protein [Septoria linicola]|uniref:GLEYA adhesin domain-containing protein n=1 Tax=Septoria linicola TaxID=215465 RepID=A0A9Q9B3A7_9PEZI|nr:Putative GLEYA adhesin domain-containing protein [Septoria linicola]